MPEGMTTHPIRLLVAPLDLEEEEQAALNVVWYMPELEQLRAQSIPLKVKYQDWSQTNPYIDVIFQEEKDATTFRTSVEARGFDQVIRRIVD